MRLDDIGTDRLNWLDFWALAKYADHTTAMYRSVNGHNWSIDTYLAAAHFDQLNGLLWQNGGGKSRKPKPFPRPKTKTTEDEAPEVMGKAADIDDIKAFLRRKNGR